MQNIREYIRCTDKLYCTSVKVHLQKMFTEEIVREREEKEREKKINKAFVKYKKSLRSPYLLSPPLLRMRK